MYLDSEVTAFHEAGHAAVGLYFGFPLDRVVTKPVALDDGRIGVASCRWLQTLSYPLEEFPLDQIALMAAAGCYAEMAARRTADFSAVDPNCYILDVAQLRSQYSEREVDDSDQKTASRFHSAILELDELYSSEPRLGAAQEKIYLRCSVAIRGGEAFVAGTEVEQIFREAFGKGA